MKHAQKLERKGPAVLPKEPSDPMETFDMVNRHTEKVIRKAQSRRQRFSKEAPAPPAGRKASQPKRPSPAGKSPRPGRDELIRKNVQRQKIRHKKNYILYYVLLLFILTVTGVILSLTVFFKIQVIQVVGNDTIPVAELIEASGIQIEDNLFRVSTDRAAKAIIGQFVTVDAVKISRKLPNRIVIEVTPSQVGVLVHGENRYYSVSKGDRVIAVSEERPILSGIPVVVGCDYSEVELGDYLDELDVERNKLETMNTVLEAIEVTELKNINYIDLNDLAFIKLYYEERLELKMGGLADFAYELGRVRQLIEQSVPENEYGVIDATLHNGSYYYRDTGSITLPEGAVPVSLLKNDGIAGYDLPGDDVPRDAVGEEAGSEPETQDSQ